MLHLTWCCEICQLHQPKFTPAAINERIISVVSIELPHACLLSVTVGASSIIPDTC